MGFISDLGAIPYFLHDISIGYGEVCPSRPHIVDGVLCAYLVGKSHLECFPAVVMLPNPAVCLNRQFSDIVNFGEHNGP
jgi:hypothetical protein